jgi:AraC-like DNA-binding protein
MSRRTLARRLKGEGLTFSEILQQLRTDLTTRYLSEANLSFFQIAWLVGFQNVGAFSHSCERWKGMIRRHCGRHYRKCNDWRFAAKELRESLAMHCNQIRSALHFDERFQITNLWPSRATDKPGSITTPCDDSERFCRRDRNPG